MNKPIKAKNLPLFSIIDLNQLRRENHLEGTEVTDFFTARDGKVYLLMEQPSETQGKDWLSTPSTYTAVEIQLDWAEQRVLEAELFLLPRPAIPSCFKADTSNGINSTSLPLMVITLGKNRRLFPPVTETRSLWSSAACFAAGCCSLEKMVCSMEVFGGAMANETLKNFPQ